MFDYLLEINTELYNRYETIEKNIKSKSNSFYDSVLTFLEGFVKKTSLREELKVDQSKTFIRFISDEVFMKFMEEKCKVNRKLIQKIYDISKNINGHKHKSEKGIDIDYVIDYMKTIHEFTYAYYINNNIGKTKSAFNSKYVFDIYGDTEKQIEDLMKQRSKLERSLRDEHKQHSLLEEDYHSLENLTKKKDLKVKTIEQQKEVLQKEVNKLKDIKLTTMEEKVSRIVDILERQTILLEKMEAHLNDGKNHKWGGESMDTL